MRVMSCLLFLVLTLSWATSLVAQGAAAVADPCEDNKVRAAIAEPRVKLGLTPLPYDRAKQTLEQNRQLAVAYRELVGQCPKRADLLLEALFVTAADPQTSEAEVLRLADLAATAFADPSLPPSPLPGGLQVAEILVDRKVGADRVLRILAQAREVFGRFRAVPVADETTRANRLKLVSASEAASWAVEARAWLLKGDSAKAQERLATAFPMLDKTGMGFAASANRQYAMARKELAAVPGARLPPEGPAPPESGKAAAPPAELFTQVDVAFADLPLVDATGKKTWTRVDLAGKTWLINLWATWCAPCIAELPHIETLHRELAGRKDVGVLTLNFDFDAAKAGAFVAGKGYTFPVLMASKTMQKFTAEGIPQNWLLDSNLRIRLKAAGFDASRPELFLKQAREGLEKWKPRRD